MDTLLAEKAYEALKSKQYQEALQLYQKVLETKEGQLPVNYSRASFAASRCNEYKTAFKWAEKAFELDPENNDSKLAIAWAFYFYQDFLGKKADKKFVITWLSRISPILHQSIMLPFALAVMRAIPDLLVMESPPYISMIRWLMQINPEVLSPDPKIVYQDEGKATEYASQRETLWAQRTQVLFEARRYEECIDTCNQALAQPLKWHFNNDIWINRRKALSHLYLDNVVEALNIYKQHLITRPEWFIHYEYSVLLDKAGETQAALAEAATALMAAGPLHSKINLIRFMAEILKKRNYTKESQDHLHLYIAICIEKGWSIAEELKNEIGELVVPDAGQLQSRLRHFWKHLVEESLPALNGFITRVNEGGLSGFIADDKGHSYYFSRKDWKGGDAEPQKGMQVRFRLTHRQHPKTGEVVKNAVMVEPIQNP